MPASPIPKRGKQPTAMQYAASSGASAQLSPQLLRSCGSSSTCTKCGKPAAITLPYANQSLCQSDFVKMFESRVLRTVREFRMLKKGDVVAVGVSGGKDSCVMLHLLHKISKSLPIKLFAITIDEGIAGYRNKSLEVAKAECKKLGIPLKVVSFHKEFGKTLDKLLKERGEKLSCSFCGVMRRYALNKIARKEGATKLAIGHNSDDVAQTVMMNLMRNEPERLARFAPVSDASPSRVREGGASGQAWDAKQGAFIPRIKPLFLTPERDVAAYAVMKGIEIEFMECPYARHAFRQHVRAMLNDAEQKYPGTKLKIVKAFLSQSELMQEGAKHRLKSGKTVQIGVCKSCGEATSQKICSLCTLLKRS